MKNHFFKNIARAFSSALLVLVLCDQARSQTANALQTWVNENELTGDEQARVNGYFPDKARMQLSFAQLSFDASSPEFQVTLPDGSEVTLINSRIKSYGPKTQNWRGYTADGQGSATITVNQGMITARISPELKSSWIIRPISKDRHVIYRANQLKPPAEESPEDYQQMLSGWLEPQNDIERNPEPGEQGGMGLSGNDCYIRILVGFESGINEADPVGFAIECVELSNTIYAQSQINFEAELALAKEYSDNASTDIDDALAAWEGIIDDQFPDVHSDREHYDADFCILVVNDFDGDYVGLASTILASYSSAFCVVESGAAIDNLSFTHEIGHLMGARHDEYVDGSGDYNHGYIIHSEKVRTVMAYNDECDDNGYNCDRIEYFSTPDVNAPGTSIPLGDAGTAHHERALDENEPEFADFEPVVSDKAFSFPESIDGEMYASVAAINTIQHTASYEITNGATVVWSAGDRMQMQEGFVAEAGTSFQAKLAGCNASRMQDENSSITNAGFENGMAVSLFPNPADIKSRITLQLQHQSRVQILFRDIMGRMISEVLGSQIIAEGLYDFELNLESIPDGAYFIEVIADGEHSMKKLIVQK
jgi:hypothetical protein